MYMTNFLAKLVLMMILMCYRARNRNRNRNRNWLDLCVSKRELLSADYADFADLSMSFLE